MHVTKLPLPRSPMPTIPQLREHCRIYGTHEDAYLTTLRDLATETVEWETSYGVGPNTYQVGETLKDCRRLVLPRYPFDVETDYTVNVVGPVEAKLGLDAHEPAHVLDAGDTTLPVITFAKPVTGYVEVTYGAGSHNPLALGAVRLLVDHLYAHRGVTTDEALKIVPHALDRIYKLLRPAEGAW